MKSFFAAAAALLWATTAVAQYNVQSRPFHLIAVTSNKKYNGTAFTAGHAGAAIEALLAGSKPDASNLFHFNTSKNSGTPSQFGAEGVLTYLLQGGNFKGTPYPNNPIPPNTNSPQESEGMQFYYDPSTNVALPLFQPTNTPTFIAFDKQNRANIQSYLDDTKTPPTDTKVHAFYRWYICETNYSAYQYTTLAWTLGNGKPQNPSCFKIELVRVFK